jgi:caffeoyl-CoA O-methyltransferase
VDKEQYPEAFRRALPRLRVGGLLITDNVLWSGRTARPAAKADVRTAAIRRFNRLLYRSPRLFTTIIPLRDGLAVSQKIR